MSKPTLNEIKSKHLQHLNLGFFTRKLTVNEIKSINLHY